MRENVRSLAGLVGSVRGTTTAVGSSRCFCDVKRASFESRRRRRSRDGDDVPHGSTAAARPGANKQLRFHPLSDAFGTAASRRALRKYASSGGGAAAAVYA